MQQTKKFKMADAISPYLAVSCGLNLYKLAKHNNTHNKWNRMHNKTDMQSQW